MANLKSIKDRINSIVNTQKITSAMKMVAAAKVKKCENAVKASRPFTNELNEMLKKLLRNIEEVRKETPDFPNAALLERREVKTVGLLVLSSDKGLAGAYNANIGRAVVSRIKELKSEGKDVKLFVTGQKGFNILKKEQERLGFEIVKTYQSFTDGDGAAAGTAIAEDMSRYFLENKIDSMSIVTTRFKNMMSYSVENWDILPLKADYEEEEKAYSSDFEFEPGLTVILSKLVPYYVANIIYQALLEAAASELASRMTAMSAASKNASEMISKLTVDYNKARQWAITQELTEVVAGADAQK